MNKDEKIFKKFKAKYSFILNDKFLVEQSKNHFDNKCAFIVFLLGLLENQIGQKKLTSQLRVNNDEWSELFCTFYKNTEIQNLYKKLEINPLVPIEQIISSFSCFNDYINLFVSFVKHHDLNLNIEETKIKSLIKNVFGYLLYNNIDCAIPYRLEQILLDKEYDNKYVMILNNTKLFSLAKQGILNNCDDKINDLIVLLLGMSNQLNKTK